MHLESFSYNTYRFVSSFLYNFFIINLGLRVVISVNFRCVCPYLKAKIAKKLF